MMRATGWRLGLARRGLALAPRAIASAPSPHALPAPGRVARASAARWASNTRRNVPASAPSEKTSGDQPSAPIRSRKESIARVRKKLEKDFLSETGAKSVTGGLNLAHDLAALIKSLPTLDELVLGDKILSNQIGQAICQLAFTSPPVHSESIVLLRALTELVYDSSGVNLTKTEPCTEAAEFCAAMEATGALRVLAKQVNRSAVGILPTQVPNVLANFKALGHPLHDDVRDNLVKSALATIEKKNTTAMGKVMKLISFSASSSGEAKEAGISKLISKFPDLSKDELGAILKYEEWINSERLSASLCSALNIPNLLKSDSVSEHLSVIEDTGAPFDVRVQTLLGFTSRFHMDRAAICNPRLLAAVVSLCKVPLRNLNELRLMSLCIHRLRSAQVKVPAEVIHAFASHAVGLSSELANLSDKELRYIVHLVTKTANLGECMAIREFLAILHDILLSRENCSLWPYDWFNLARCMAQAKFVPSLQFCNLLLGVMEDNMADVLQDASMARAIFFSFGRFNNSNRLIPSSVEIAEKFLAKIGGVSEKGDGSLGSVCAEVLTATALTAKLSAEDLNGDLHERVLETLDHLWTESMQIGPSPRRVAIHLNSLADTMYVFARCKYQPSDAFYDNLEKSFARFGLTMLRSRQLANLWWSLAALDYELTGSSPLPGIITQDLPKLLPMLSLQGVAVTTNGLGRIGYYNSQLFCALEEEFRKHEQPANAIDLPQFFFGLALAEHDVDELTIALIETKAQELIPEMSAQAVSNILYAMYKLEAHPSAEFLQAVASFIDEHGEELEAQHYANILFAYFNMNIEPPVSYWNNFDRSLSKCISEFLPQELLNIVRGTGHFDHHIPESTFLAIEKALASEFQNMCANTLANCTSIMSQSKNNVSEEYMTQVEATVVSRLDSFQPRQICRVILGFVRQDHVPSEEFFRKLEATVLGSLDAYSVEDLAVLNKEYSSFARADSYSFVDTIRARLESLESASQ